MACSACRVDPYYGEFDCAHESPATVADIRDLEKRLDEIVSLLRMIGGIRTVDK